MDGEITKEMSRVEMKMEMAGGQVHHAWPDGRGLPVYEAGLSDDGKIYTMSDEADD